MRHWNHRARVFSAVAAFAVAVGALAAASGWKAMGTTARGARLDRMHKSPEWRESHFDNGLARRDGPYLRMTWAWLTAGSDHRVPNQPISTEHPSRTRFDSAPAGGMRITWLGHSTLLVELDGRRVLIDPVWGDRASPFTWAGPKRFYPPPLPFTELPALDAVLISHDHYDHLDYPTVLKLVDSTQAPFLVPLGVGAHLEYWGVPGNRIVELDWWQQHAVAGLSFVATPARHFSGRSLFDQQKTLWAGWAIIGSRNRAYYSGDTAMFPELADIGARLGPFDVTMIEAGAYNDMWADVHLGPEQAVMAHRMVRGDLLIPVHWGLFDLALHGWTEPMERVLVAAKQSSVTVASPLPGGSVELGRSLAEQEKWWPEVLWRTVEEEPAFSSGLRANAFAKWSSPAWLPLIAAKQ